MRTSRLLTLFLLLLPIALAFGCADESGTNDASSACENLCDELEGCGHDLGDDGACNEVCDDIDDLEGELSDSCEEAFAGLLTCASGLSCEELNVDDLETVDQLNEFIDDFLEDLFAECGFELRDVAADCDGELEEG